MKKFLLLLALLFLQCGTTDPFSNKADCIVTGTVYPGIASGQKGLIYVTVSQTNDHDKTDWQSNTDQLQTFGTFKIEELMTDKYYIIIHLDSNKNGERDRDEYWGGYDANGDGRLDPVKLIGGETTVADVTFFDMYN